MYNKIPSIIIAFFVISAIIPPTTCTAEISPQDYCKLSTEVYETKTLRAEDAIDILSSSNESKEILDKKIEERKTYFENKILELYSKYSTTADEFSSYMKKNHIHVNDYLRANPAVESTIKSIVSNLYDLLDEIETLRQK